MAIPETHIQEKLSLAYVKAIAAQAGVNFVETGGNDYGVDAFIQKVIQLENGKLVTNGYPMQCQIKASSVCIVEEQDVVFDVKADAYNKLIAAEKAVLLIVFRMPKGKLDWLSSDEDALKISNCCYWYIVDGLETKNSEQKRIRIPRVQQFNEESINTLLNHVNDNAGRFV